MAYRLKPWQDAILAKLRADLNDAIPVKDAGYGEGADENVGRLDNGMLQPYVLVWFGGGIDAGIGHGGITGVRYETRTAMLHIETIGPTGTMARDLGDEVRDSLMGFQPDGEGELAEDGMPTIRNPISTTTGLDVRYAYAMTFKGTVNSKSVPAVG